MAASKNAKASPIGFALQTPFILTNILMIVIYLIILDYIRQLEATGCACSKDWRRTFIYWYVAIGAIYVLLQTLAAAIGSAWLTIAVSAYGLAPMIWFVSTVVFVVSTLQYVHRLKKEKCLCSEAAGRTVLHIVGWVHLILWAFILFSVIFGAIIAGTLMTVAASR
jgi:hypothetical protein